MKLKDILKTDTDNTGWLKTFKKLGADREMLQYVNNNISKEGGGNSLASKLKSRKVCWKLDNEKLTDETFNQLKLILTEILANYPLYSSIHEKYDSATSNLNKYYGPFVNIPLCMLLLEDSAKWNTWYFEEAEDIENHFDGFMEYFKKLDPSITEEMLYEMIGLKKIPYEEYMALRVDEEKGKDYIN